MQKIKLIKMMSSPVDSSVALSTTCSITAKHTVNALRRCEASVRDHARLKETTCPPSMRPLMLNRTAGRMDDRGSATCCRVCVKHVGQNI